MLENFVRFKKSLYVPAVDAFFVWLSLCPRHEQRLCMCFYHYSLHIPFSVSSLSLFPPPTSSVFLGISPRRPAPHSFQIKQEHGRVPYHLSRNLNSTCNPPGPCREPLLPNLDLVTNDNILRIEYLVPWSLC